MNRWDQRAMALRMVADNMFDGEPRDMMIALASNYDLRARVLRQNCSACWRKNFGVRRLRRQAEMLQPIRDIHDQS